MRFPRRTALIAALALAAAGCGGSSSSSAGHPGPHPATAPASSATPSRPATAGRPVVTTAVAAWRLPAPASRMVALPDGGHALLLGGLGRGDASSDAIYLADVTSGVVTRAGTLARRVHDASGARLAGRIFVFGGGAGSTTAAIQRFDGTGTGRVVGQLPQPRSDLSAVTVDGHAYILGGYTGSAQVAGVLETTDGTTLHRAATLPVSVRYAAVAAVGPTIWVFGGAHGGAPTDVIQRIDTRTGRAVVAGHLPTALTEAAALVVDGHLLLAGGRGAGDRVSGRVYEFLPASGRISKVAELKVPVADPGVAVVGGIGYLFGGENSTQVRTVQTIDVRSDPTVKSSP